MAFHVCFGNALCNLGQRVYAMTYVRHCPNPNNIGAVYLGKRVDGPPSGMTKRILSNDLEDVELLHCPGLFVM